jgi:membrane protein
MEDRVRGMSFSWEQFRSAVHLGGLSLREAAVRTWKGINKHAVLTRAAAIGFYAIAALVPYLGLLIVLTARWLPRIESAAPAGSVFDNIEPVGVLLPPESVTFLRAELARLQRLPQAGVISFSLVALLWFASSVFVEIIDAMNAIFGIKDSRPFWKRRLIAAIMTVSQATILIMAMVTIIGWPQIVRWLGLGARAELLATIVHGVTVCLMILFSFLLALQVGPDTSRRWEWILPGSLLGTLILLIVSLLFRSYVQNWGNYSATYGSLAGIIGLMTWLWISSALLLVAAEFNKVIEDASPYGRRVARAGETIVPGARMDEPNGVSAADRRPAHHGCRPSPQVSK